MNDNVFLLYGTDRYLIRQATEKIMSDRSIAAEDVYHFDLDETPLEDAVSTAMTIPFLTELQGVVISNATVFSEAKPTKEMTAQFGFLLRYLANPNPATLMVIQVPAEKLEVAKPILEQLKSKVQMTKLGIVDKNDFYRIVREKVAAAGLKIDAGALEEFVNRAGSDMMNLHNELDKLILYSLGKPTIDISAVKLVTMKEIEDNIFELVNQILIGDKNFAFRIYRDLIKSNIDPVTILSLIAAKFQEILYAKELIRQNNTFDQIMKYFNYSRGRAYYLHKNAQEMPDEVIYRYLSDLERADFRIKSGELDKRLGLELILFG
jgi:DNA polymerase-3 subunit delta